MTRFAAAIIVSLLAGCNEAPEHDLLTWMSEVRQQAHALPGELPPRPPLKEFQYEVADRLDPFDMRQIAKFEKDQRSGKKIKKRFKKNSFS